MTDDLIELLQALDAPQLTYRRLDSYFNGDSPLSFLSREAKVALRNFEQITSNLCRTAVVSLQERLRLSGMSGAWDLFEYSDLDQLSSDAHRSALLYGWCPILCWTDATGKPRATVESPKQVCVARDPVSRDIVKAAKRVRTKDATLVWVYYPDRVESWKSNSPSSGNTGFVLVETVPHSLGVCPIVAVGHEDEQSVIADLLTIQDGINKLLSDMLVASEYAGRPRRFASGIELTQAPKLDAEGNVVTDPDTGEVVTEPKNPFPESNRMMISADPASRFGSIPAADLQTFEAGIRVLISQAMMVSGLPAHYVGLLQDSVTSADALRAAEAALVARAEARQRTYGVGWESVGRLLIAIRDGVDPSSVVARARWSPADTRSEAQTADAAVKMFQAGILSRTAVLRRLGLDEDEIREEIHQFHLDAEDAASVTLGRAVTRRAQAA